MNRGEIEVIRGSDHGCLEFYSMKSNESPGQDDEIMGI